MKGEKSQGDVLSQWIWRVHTTWWCSNLHCPRAEGCPHWGRVCHDRTTTLHGWIHHSTRGDNGRSTWEAAPTSFLVEWRHGATHAEEWSSFERFGVCAGGWPWACVSILLQLAGISQSFQRSGPIHLLTHSRCLCWVDREIHALWCGSPTAGGRMTTCNSHAGKVQAMHSASWATYFAYSCKWIYWFWIIRTGRWGTPGYRGSGWSGWTGDA